MGIHFCIYSILNAFFFSCITQLSYQPLFIVLGMTNWFKSNNFSLCRFVFYPQLFYFVLDFTNLFPAMISALICTSIKSSCCFVFCSFSYTSHSVGCIMCGDLLKPCESFNCIGRSAIYEEQLFCPNSMFSPCDKFNPMQPLEKWPGIWFRFLPFLLICLWWALASAFFTGSH